MKKLPILVSQAKVHKTKNNALRVWKSGYYVMLYVTLRQSFLFLFFSILFDRFILFVGFTLVIHGNSIHNDVRGFVLKYSDNPLLFTHITLICLLLKIIEREVFCVFCYVFFVMCRINLCSTCTRRRKQQELKFPIGISTQMR